MNRFVHPGQHVEVVFGHQDNGVTVAFTGNSVCGDHAPVVDLHRSDYVESMWLTDQGVQIDGRPTSVGNPPAHIDSATAFVTVEINAGDNSVVVDHIGFAFGIVAYWIQLR